MTLRPVVFLGDRILASPEEAHVSLFDRGYLLGDSIFETMRTYGGAVFRLDAHLDRLERASRVTGIELPYARAELSAIVRDVVGRVDAGDVNVRVTVSRGVSATPGLATAGCDRSVLSVTARELRLPPAEARARGIASVVVAARKVPAACIDPTIKTGALMPAVLARRELEARGAMEGVQLSIDGAVVSGVASNVFAVRGRELVTPDAGSGCREGVTRAAVLELATASGLEPRERPLSLDDLFAADEVFFTSTVLGCVPVGSLEAKTYGAPAATLRVAAALEALARA